MCVTAKPVCLSGPPSWRELFMSTITASNSRFGTQQGKKRWGEEHNALILRCSYQVTMVEMDFVESFVDNTSGLTRKRRWCLAESFACFHSPILYCASCICSIELWHRCITEAQRQPSSLTTSQEQWVNFTTLLILQTGTVDSAYRGHCLPWTTLNRGRSAMHPAFWGKNSAYHGQLSQLWTMDTISWYQGALSLLTMDSQ